MNPLFAAAVDIQTFCARRGWRSSVIGGVAIQRWGDPRQTRDVDLTLLTGLGGEEAFVDPILEHYRARIPDARRFALERRVLLVETRDGVPLDISLGGLRPLLELKEDTTAEPRLLELFEKHRA